MATYVNKIGPNKPLITYEELSKHTSRSDCWIAIRGRVVDVTPYLAEHPGSEDILLANAGTDATEEFNRKDGEGHTEYAFSLTEKFWVGNLDYNSPKVVPKTDASASRRMYSYKEVSMHNKEEDCWIVVNNKVYDVTSFLNEHPGGPLIIVDYAGGDATKAFVEQDHSESAKKMLEKYIVGNFDQSTVPTQLPAKTGAKNGGMSPGIIAIVVGLVLAAFYFIYQKNN